MSDCSDELKIASERDYLRSVVEQIHTDTREALSETSVMSGNRNIESKTGDVRKSEHGADGWANFKVSQHYDEDGNPIGADLYINGEPFTITPTQEGFSEISRDMYQDVGTSTQGPMNRDECSCEDCEIEAEKAPGEGGWYSRFSPQPIDIIEAWGLDHWQAEALTYLVRHDMKGGAEDLLKAAWYINDLRIRKYGE